MVSQIVVNILNMIFVLKNVSSFYNYEGKPPKCVGLFL